jgi:glutathione S-transferase
MLTVQHLNVSQSERVIWLLEELELPYELRSVHPLGSVPVLCDREIVMAESGAILEYVRC